MSKYDIPLDFAIALMKAIELIVDQCIEHAEDYPLETAVIFHLLYGLPISGSMTCPNCHKKLEISSEETVGGLDSICDEITDLVKILQLEIDYEQGGCEREEDSVSGTDAQGEG